MKPDPAQWIVTRVNGKIAAVSTDYGLFAKVAQIVSELPPETVSEVGTEKISTLELMDLSMRTRWEDLKLFGTAFQLKVWRQLYLLTHKSDGTPRLPEDGVKLLSYSQLAKLCDNPSGVRAVAHAVARNPISGIIPCHLIIPKESIDKVLAIRTRAQSTIFKGADLYFLDSIDVGEYAWGSDLKRRLIALQLYRHMR